MPRMALLREKNAQKNYLVSHSPFQLQGRYKYPAKPYHTAVLQLQGHLVLGFVFWPEETSALSYLPPQETTSLPKICLKCDRAI